MKQASQRGFQEGPRLREREARLLGSRGLEENREDHLGNTAVTLRKKSFHPRRDHGRAGVSIQQGSVLRTQLRTESLEKGWLGELERA